MHGTWRNPSVFFVSQVLYQVQEISIITVSMKWTSATLQPGLPRKLYDAPYHNHDVHERVIIPDAMHHIQLSQLHTGVPGIQMYLPAAEQDVVIIAIGANFTEEIVDMGRDLETQRLLKELFGMEEGPRWFMDLSKWNYVVYCTGVVSDLPGRKSTVDL
ncbi:hypothetical protein EIP91_009776 [Steccherinum ochraceum]|uniref:Uncharacterized protein n=1 Tax=Steccherinum ochraceum TaxID=92696 RepID=A0A4R0R184_9APHY|nr:hypothetical protein EIP91_009776 [Steccherinum ochraceum]